MKKKINTISELKLEVDKLRSQRVSNVELGEMVADITFAEDINDEALTYLQEEGIIIDEDETFNFNGLEGDDYDDEMDDLEDEILDFMSEYKDFSDRGMSSNNLLKSSVNFQKNSVKNYPILTPEEEINLTTYIGEAMEERKEREDAIKARIESEREFMVDDLLRVEMLKEFPEPETLKRAKDTLMLANMRLVISIASNHAKGAMPFEDLIQEGFLGLKKAVDKFDYKVGTKFSTYATWWIRQSIMRAIADNSRVIRIPVHMNEQMSKYNKARNILVQRLGRVPTTEEIAKEMGMEVEKVLNIEKHSKETLSFDAPVNDEADSTLVDYVEDENSMNLHDELQQEELRKFLEKELRKVLTQREIDVLFLRHGIGEDRPLTLKEIGAIFGVTRERIRQIEAKALEKLQEHDEIKESLKIFLH